MWVGLLYEKPADGDVDCAFALFYEPHLPLVVEASGGVEQPCPCCGGDLASLPARCVAEA